MIQNGLERRILHGLAHEWEIGITNLETHQQVLMKKPLFSLGDFSAKLGFWSPDCNEIRLGRNLVLNHPWDAVREVLLHEMAHQMAHQVFNARNEPPHGPAFRKACVCLRADPRPAGSYRPLDERVFNTEDEAEDRRLMRVRKLMALAESKYPHEADAAMAKAHELIGKYNIRLIETDRKRDFFSVFLGRPRLRHTRDRYRMAGLLCEFYFVRGIWIPAYVLEKGKVGSVLEITGTRTNIQIAAYVHDFVHQYIAAQWQSYSGKHRLDQHRRTDFAVGVIQGFMNKLGQRSSAAVVSGTDQSLMNIEDPLLVQHMANRYPRVTTIVRKSGSQNKKVIMDGVEIGKSMVIHKGISNQTLDGGLFKIEG